MSAPQPILVKSLVGEPEINPLEHWNGVHDWQETKAQIDELQRKLDAIREEVKQL